VPVFRAKYQKPNAEIIAHVRDARIIHKLIFALMRGLSLKTLMICMIQ
jgi:hypothetical protein